MKKLISLLLVLAMALSMAACRTKTPDPTNPNPTSGPTDPAPTDPEPTDPPIDNTLIEYYLKKADEVKITETHVTFTDDSGRGEISIAKNPKNVAILYPSLTCLWSETGATAPMIIGGSSGIEL